LSMTAPPESAHNPAACNLKYHNVVASQKD
jgi:hypothetical protein